MIIFKSSIISPFPIRMRDLGNDKRGCKSGCKRAESSWLVRVTSDEIRRKAGVKKISALVPSAMTLDGSCSVNDTKPQLTRGTDLDTKRERKSRSTERNADTNYRKRA